MSTSIFPGDIDTFETLVDNKDNVVADHPNKRASAIVKLQDKVGADDSAVATSHDYKLTHLPGQAQNWDAGSYEVRAQTLQSDVATGTAPLTITSTTKVANLNVDQVDGADLDTNGALTANSDVKIPSQKAVKTYADAIKTTADNALPLSYLDTDGALTANSDVKIASQKAVKTYSDGKISKTTTGEIAAMTEKATLHDNDLVLIEDSEASNAKKKAKKSSFIPGVDNTTVEISSNNLRVKDAGISQAKLKTATGEVSTVVGAKGSENETAILPGGEYGFVVTVKKGSSYSGDFVGFSYAGLTASYTSCKARFKNTSDWTDITYYAQQRYVTSSGQDHWVFLLVDKETGNIEGAYSAPDHPMYGNGGDINEVPHPFIGNDLTGKEVVLLSKSEVAALKGKVSKKESLLTVLHKEYDKVDMKKELVYEPLHTGEFLETNPVKLESLPNGIKVRELVKK